MQHENNLQLPTPDALSVEQSKRVAEHLRDRIGDGDISFAEFVNEALYAPGLGYYAAGSTKFGQAGDFITAPEVSSMYGSVLARQMVEVLDSVEGGAILEYGAGSGKLAGHAPLVDAAPWRRLQHVRGQELPAAQRHTSGDCGCRDLIARRRVVRQHRKCPGKRKVHSCRM